MHEFQIADSPPSVPPNVQFQVDDVESEWTFPDPFDFIHSRYMIGSILDWPGLIKKIFRYGICIKSLLLMHYEFEMGSSN